MKVSLIIPMYNESKIIGHTADTLCRYMSDNFDDYEILFCDDGSTDCSKEAVESLRLDNVRVISYSDNRGKGSAVRVGMLEAKGDVRIFTDADLAYGTDVIAAAVDTLAKNEGADILIGSRNIGMDGYDGYTLGRKLMSKMYIRILCLVGGFKLSDSQCGFKVFTADSANAVFSQCKVDGFAFDFEAILIANKQNRKIIEMPVKVINHRDSSIKPLKDAFKMLRDIRRIKKDVKSSK